MKDSTAKKIDELLERYPALEPCRESLYAAVDKICESFRGGGKLMTCGNGGSAADAQHIVGELMKGFLLPREIDSDFTRRAEKLFPDDVDYFRKNLQGALPAISLVGETALITAFSNDKAPDLIFAQSAGNFHFRQFR